MEGGIIPDFSFCNEPLLYDKCVLISQGKVYTKPSSFLPGVTHVELQDQRTTISPEAGESQAPGFSPEYILIVILHA